MNTSEFPDFEPDMINGVKLCSKIYPITNCDQTMNALMIFVANDYLTSIIKSDEELNKYVYKISFGDGDEGCIYITLKIKM